MHTYCMLTLGADCCKCRLYEKQVKSSHLQKKKKKIESRTFQTYKKMFLKCDQYPTVDL